MSNTKQNLLSIMWITTTLINTLQTYILTHPLKCKKIYVAPHLLRENLGPHMKRSVRIMVKLSD